MRFLLALILVSVAWGQNSPGLAGPLGGVSATTALGKSQGAFVTNAQTSTYQVVAADFLACKTIPVASGTFNITLVASTSQPASGQCITILNYGTGVVTLVRSGQNINGAAANLTGIAGSSTAPTGWYVVSDGTNYIAEVIGAAGGTMGSVAVAGTTNQITATGTCSSSTAVNCTLSIPSNAALPGAPTTTTASSGDNTTKIATTAFTTTAINNALAGVNPAVAVQAATTTAGNTSALAYNNGVSGVGATLTGANNTALTVDGFTFTALGQRLLVKNDTQSPSGAFNGIYYVTQVQALALPLILTRALDYDMSSDINNTGAIPVVNGTVNALTSWLLTSAVNTVGTDPLTYSQFSVNPTNQVTSVNGNMGAVTCIQTGTAGCLLEEHSASASTELDFTTCFQSAYDEYEIRFNAMAPTTTNLAIVMQFGTGGGPTYDTGNNYSWQVRIPNSGTAFDAGNSTSTSDIQIGPGQQTTDAHFPMSGVVHVSNPASATAFKLVWGNTISLDTRNTIFSAILMWGVYNSATPVTAFRVFSGTLGTNTIASGTVRCYGITK